MDTSIRRIKKSWKSEPTIEGAGVRLRRAFGSREVPQFDPFLLLDDFRSDDPADYLSGFPWHPHRGIETITYVLDGEVEHQDSLGNGGVIKAGEIQWMTAGGGIMHQEMPKGSREGRMYGFQLWANLPASRKMMAPRYRGHGPKEIPIFKKDGAEVRVVAGTAGGVQGPVRDVVIDPEYLDVSLKAGSRFEHAIKPGHTVLSYVVEGQGWFDEKKGEACGTNTLVQYERGGGAVRVETKSASVRFILVSGKPIGEPVAWYGPIVMNTQAELRRAVEELDAGTFIQRKK